MPRERIRGAVTPTRFMARWLEHIPQEDRDNFDRWLTALCRTVSDQGVQYQTALRERDQLDGGKP